MLFCVAITKNGAGSSCVTPSTLTWNSSMHSRRLDCVLGVARLISSASTICAKTGPGLKTNSPVFWLKTEVPVMSEGSRSGVNWIRLKVQSSERASARASIVLPVPGTSSISKCPPHRLGLAHDHRLDLIDHALGPGPHLRQLHAHLRSLALTISLAGWQEGVKRTGRVGFSLCQPMIE